MERALAFSTGWVNVTDLIFAETEDASHDLFPIKPNERMHACWRVFFFFFLEITFSILLNYLLRNLIFCLKACLPMSRGF